jgi:hypothetical protein
MAKKTLKKDWSKINDKIKNRNNKTNDKDERIFVPTYNDKQTCKVTMRFLDTTDTDLPYVTVMQHFFSENMRWYVNHCPATIGKKCPVCDDLYKNKYFDKDKTIYDNRKKTTSFYTNVLIIDDVNNPTNNGKVFLFKFGVKIMDKIDDIIEEGKFPWDDNVGVNFIFTGKKNGKQTSYDASRFSDTETALEDYGDEDKILSLRHSLKSLIADDLFKEEMSGISFSGFERSVYRAFEKMYGTAEQHTNIRVKEFAKLVEKVGN